MKTQTDIVLETLQFYLEDPQNRRAAHQGGCYYRIPGEVPRHCALGRCMTDEALDRFETSGNTAEVLAHDYGSLDQLLKPEYHGHSTEFWSNLQRLHDHDPHWDRDDALPRRRFVATRFPDALPKAIELRLV